MAEACSMSADQDQPFCLTPEVTQLTTIITITSQALIEILHGGGYTQCWIGEWVSRWGLKVAC